MLVQAFKPRKYDPPRFVAEERHDLVVMLGDFIGAGQCDGCGNSTYQIEADGNRVVAVCRVDPSDEFKHPDPCGAHYTISGYGEDEVEF